MVTVCNFYKYEKSNAIPVFIGRLSSFNKVAKKLDGVLNYSILGNPYSSQQFGGRDEACDLYADWLKDRISCNSTQRKAMRELYDIGRTKDIDLICFCTPKRCHGDTIKMYLDM
jgi:hypothetical protein